MSKKSFIDSVEVKNPCTEDWEKMHGNDRVRFCDHCAKDVKNLSAVTRKEAMRMVRASGGSLCIRYKENPATRRPIFADQLFQITRRSPSIAAGVMTASLSLSTLTYAQGSSSRVTQPEPPAVERTESDSANKKDAAADPKLKVTGSLSGTLTDPHGAVIPNFAISLLNTKTNAQLRAVTNDEGSYEFKAVDPGSYTLQASAAYGFAAKTVEGIEIADGQILLVNLPIETITIVTVGGLMMGMDYRSPLHRAVANDDIEQVRELIAQGEKINGKDENYDNITPLFIAVENGNVEIARLLLEFGAKINARDGQKQTPIMRLDDDATPELVALLLDYGAKIDRVDKSGNTAMIIAADRVNPEVLQALIEAGADVNKANKEGQTALMNAANNDLLESVRVLLLAHATVDLKNKEGETALELTSNEEIEQLLISFGAEVKELPEGNTSEPTDN